MKILHVINSLRIGGAETLVVDMAIEMSKKHSVTVFVLGEEDTFLTKKLQSEKVEIIKLTKKIRSFKNFKWLQKNMKHYDVVHSHLTYAQYFVSLAARTNKKCKIITTEHSTSNRRQQKPWIRPLEKLMYKPYDKIIVISEGTKKAMIKWQPEFQDKIELIHNGIDVNKFKDAKPNQEILQSNKIKLLMVAAFRNEKDQDTVVRALKLLDDKYELYFVGDGERKYNVEKLTEELDLTSRVHFLGVRSDVAEIMKACDIFILSSHWEGFGLVAAEAMSAGLPVIGTNVEGLKEVIDDENMLFEVGNEQELANKIKNSYQDKKTNKIIDKYSVVKTLEKHIVIYERKI